MMTWVYALPAWILMPVTVGLTCLITGIALYYTRNRLTRNDLITHNDVASAILQMLGTVLAVMMSFMVVGVWQQYDTAGQNTQVEASALSDLYHLADALPQTTRKLIQTDVNAYLNLVLHDEWPLLVHGSESWRASQKAYQIQQEITEFRPPNEQASLVQSEAISYASQFLDARRQRIRDNATGIPNILWATMLVVGAVTIFFSFYFKVQQPVAQHIMVAALTTVITLIFVLIAELDYPFRGDIAIHPDAYQHVYNALHHIGFSA
ncbi:MAG TPA: DUF4239 domain-containing protein [Candidatus Rubrimentiphilum sp.]|nr:DUF4239 domain-containing protein [Candidatus Rubrimentiphilum sp.]